MVLKFVPQWLSLFMIIHGLNSFFNLIIIWVFFLFGHNILGIILLLRIFLFLPTFFLTVFVLYFILIKILRKIYDSNEFKFPLLIASLIYLLLILLTRISYYHFEYFGYGINTAIYGLVFLFSGFLILFLQAPKLSNSE